jgi:hypothetical protein
VKGSSGSVLAKRSAGFAPVAKAGAAIASASAHVIVIAIDRFVVEIILPPHRLRRVFVSSFIFLHTGRAHRAGTYVRQRTIFSKPAMLSQARLCVKRALLGAMVNL